MRRATALILTLFLGLPALAQDGSAPPPSGPCAQRSNRISEHERVHSGYLDKACVEATRKAEECCLNPAQEKCGHKESNFGQKPQTEEERKISGIYQPAVNQARDLTTAMNRNRANAALCRTHNERRKKSCAEAAGKKEQELAQIRENPNAPSEAKETLVKAAAANREYSDNGDRDLEVYRACHSRQADQNQGDLDESIKTANAAIGGDDFSGTWKSACTSSRIGDETVRQCYLQNTGDNGGEIVQGADRDKLPVTTVPTPGCSAYTDPSGALTSASHCPMPEILGSARKSGSGADEFGVFRKQAELPFDPNKLNSGEPLADKVQYSPLGGAATPDQFKGKPFYHLAQDTSLASGCEARGNILACSPSALNSIQGVPAEMQGFPGEHFKRGSPDFAGTLDPKEATLVTRGPAYYDPYSEKLNVNGFIGPGNSGGPVYFKEGTTIGGFTTDRPIVAGPAHSVAGFVRSPTSNVPTDGSAYAYSQRTGLVPIASVSDTSRLMVPRVDNSTLRQGGAVFQRAPPPAPTNRRRRR